MKAEKITRAEKELACLSIELRYLRADIIKALPRGLGGPVRRWLSKGVQGTGVYPQTPYSGTQAASESYSESTPVESVAKDLYHGEDREFVGVELDAKHSALVILVAGITAIILFFLLLVIGTDFYVKLAGAV